MSWLQTNNKRASSLRFAKRGRGGERAFSLRLKNVGLENPTAQEHLHIHLENNILFPKTVELEKKLTMNKINIKRIYETPLVEDGYRMLVDRLWPRGLKKEDAAIDEWNKIIAPSTELRKWFGHKAENFERFTEAYKIELRAKLEELERIKSIAKTQNLTLLYAAKDKKINHARILLSVIKAEK